MSLLGTDGLKTGSSDVADYNHTITTKRNNFRINQVIMGSRRLREFRWRKAT